MKNKINKEALINLFEIKVIDSTSSFTYDYIDDIHCPTINFAVDLFDPEAEGNEDEVYFEERCDMSITYNINGYFLTFKDIKVLITHNEYKKLHLLFKKCVKKYELKQKKEKLIQDFKILNKILSQEIEKEKRVILFEKLQND